MCREPLIIGVSANLISGGSVHTDTFIRAVKMASEDLTKQGRDGIGIVWANDSATSEGGRSAALQLVKQGVQLVVGHYASSAAKAALPVYRDAGIPVLLPAATADSLVRDFENAFRLCRNDSSMADYMLSVLGETKKYERVTLLNDHSVHGASLSGLLRSKASGRCRIADAEQASEAVVFVGSYYNSIGFLQTFRSGNTDCPVFFTDDAVSGSIVRDTGYHAGLTIFGYSPCWYYPDAKAISRRYRQINGHHPFTYFVETYAAMQIALGAVRAPAFRKNRYGCIEGTLWRTIMGEVKFNGRENLNGRFSLWQITGSGRLAPVP